MTADEVSERDHQRGQDDLLRGVRQLLDDGVADISRLILNTFVRGRLRYALEKTRTAVRSVFCFRSIARRGHTRRARRACAEHRLRRVTLLCVAITIDSGRVTVIAVVVAERGRETAAN